MLETISTPFGIGTVIEEHILEVVVHSGIELNRDIMLNGYSTLAELAGGKFVLLVDRTQSNYSLTLDALKESGNHPDLLAQALLIPPYNENGELAADMIVNFPRKNTLPVEFFSDRESALYWLRSHRDHYLRSL
jgi:hypothetical protein